MIVWALILATIRSILEITATQVKIPSPEGTTIVKLTDIVSVSAMRDEVFESDSASPGVCIRHADGEDVVFRYIYGYAGRCHLKGTLRQG